MSVYHEGQRARYFSNDRCTNPYEGVGDYILFRIPRQSMREKDCREWYRGWDAQDFEERQKYPYLFKDRLSVVPPDKS